MLPIAAHTGENEASTVGCNVALSGRAVGYAEASARESSPHQSVRLWAKKFGRHFANDIRKRSAGRLGDKWHLDEVVIYHQLEAQHLFINL
ncbi:hypothetical protein [Rhizobium rhizogenes]|uniref:hypothetical protein n=1 Tax=Rhizobium rhizogenes TaxID=359 RepID=UPI00385774A2